MGENIILVSLGLSLLFLGCISLPTNSESNYTNKEILANVDLTSVSWTGLSYAVATAVEGQFRFVEYYAGTAKLEFNTKQKVNSVLLFSAKSKTEDDYASGNFDILVDKFWIHSQTMLLDEIGKISKEVTLDLTRLFPKDSNKEVSQIIYCWQIVVDNKPDFVCKSKDIKKPKINLKVEPEYLSWDVPRNTIQPIEKSITIANLSDFKVPLSVTTYDAYWHKDDVNTPYLSFDKETKLLNPNEKYVVKINITIPNSTVIAEKYQTKFAIIVGDAPTFPEEGSYFFKKDIPVEVNISQQ